MIECLEFKVAIKKDGGVRSVAVIQQSQEQEEHAGDIELLWFYTSEMAQNNDWFLGRVEVHAQYYEEVVQNYTVRLVAEHGKANREGWAALDNLQMFRSEDCMTEPKEAVPPPTAPPTESSTISPDEDVFCNFQDNLCNFTVQGSDLFKFKRTKASSVGLIGEDHNHSPDGMILYAEGESPEENDWTSVLTTMFKGQDHVVECFHFWFFVDGFLVGFIIFIEKIFLKAIF